MRIAPFGLVLVVSALFLARGEALAQAVNVQLFTKVPQGSQPKIRITAAEAVSSVVISLTRDDGKKVSLKTGALGEGAFREFPLPQPPGKRSYAGSMVAVRKGDKQSGELRFDAIVAPPLQIQVDKTKVDLPGHKLEVRLSRPAGKIELRVTGDGGLVLAEEEHNFSGKAAGEPLVVGWTPRAAGDVMKVHIEAYDEDGMSSGIDIVPWSVHIPHEEVNFRTDSADVDAAERPKLEASFTKVADALTRYKDIGAIALFIAGHTDAVGNDQYNLTLSQRRASAIGGWFRKRGLRIPIAYEGFGESAPLVKTADGIDEPRNRRVDYILAVEPPTLKATGYKASWKRVN